MEGRTTTAVLSYYKYLGSDSQSVYNTQYFCGSCRRNIGSPYGHPESPEDLEAENNAPPFGHSWKPNDEPLEYYAFCPWCGSHFEGDWQKDRTIQNERVIDHYQNPGTHKGDTHEFQGDGPECYVNHWLGVSGGDKVCWCNPEIEPGIMGCVIRHQDKNFEVHLTEVEAKRAEREDENDLDA